MINPLTLYLKGIGRKVFNVEADGNCMFRCFSHQLFGSPKKHYAVRSLLVRFISKNRDKFSPLLTEINSPNIASHIDEMCNNKKWGTHVEIFATSTYFQIPVYYLKSPSCKYKWEVFKPLGSVSNFKYQLCPEVDTSAEDITVPDHFELSLSSGNHYDSIVSILGGVCMSRPTLTDSYDDCRDLVL